MYSVQSTGDKNDLLNRNCLLLGWLLNVFTTLLIFLTSGCLSIVCEMDPETMVYTHLHCAFGICSVTSEKLITCLFLTDLLF